MPDGLLYGTTGVITENPLKTEKEFIKEYLASDWKSNLSITIYYRLISTCCHKMKLLPKPGKRTENIPYHFHSIHCSLSFYQREKHPPVLMYSNITDVIAASTLTSRISRIRLWFGVTHLSLP